MVTSALFSCAYCGVVNETTVDLSAGESQKYIEDCQVCCRANTLQVSGSRETDEAWIEALSEDD